MDVNADILPGIFYFAPRGYLPIELTMITKEEKLAWAKKKNSLKRKYVFLQDKDFKYEEGKQEVVLAKIQKRLGKTNEEWQEIIASL
jgi:hypothetical protein